MLIEQKIKATVDKIRPFLQRDGGDIKFIKFLDGYVFVKLLGACMGCSLSDAHIKEGVEIILQEEIKGIIGLKIIN